MIVRVLVAALSIFIGACASSGPETPAPTATASLANVDAIESDESSAAPAAEIHDLDAPNVETIASTAPEDNSDEIVCRKERATGTNIRRTVCRKRVDIEEREQKDQDRLREMRKIKTGSHEALNE